MSDEVIYPIAQFHFEVNWGDTTFICSEISGIDSNLEKIEYRDANVGWTTAQPGLQSFSDMELTKAIFEEVEDYQVWHDKVAKEREEYRDTISVVLKNELGDPVMTWEFQNAWVFTWDSPDLDSMASEVSIEKIVVAYESVVVER